MRGSLPGLLLATLGLVVLAIAATPPFRLPSGRPGPGVVPMLVAGALAGLVLLLPATFALPPARALMMRAVICCGAL